MADVSSSSSPGRAPTPPVSIPERATGAEGAALAERSAGAEGTAGTERSSRAEEASVVATALVPSAMTVAVTAVAMPAAPGMLPTAVAELAAPAALSREAEALRGEIDVVASHRRLLSCLGALMAPV